MIEFKQGGKARLKNFGSPADGIPEDGEYSVVGITPCKVKIDLGNEIVTLTRHKALKYEWATEAKAALMYFAVA